MGNFNKAIQENERALLLKKKREKLEGQRLELASKKDSKSSIRTNASDDAKNGGDEKTVDRLLNSMRQGDGDMFKRRRDSMNKRKIAMEDSRVSSSSIEESIAVLRQKVASKWDSDEDASSDSTDDEWD